MLEQAAPMPWAMACHMRVASCSPSAASATDQWFQVRTFAGSLALLCSICCIADVAVQGRSIAYTSTLRLFHVQLARFASEAKPSFLSLLIF
jgi:hypothetical protein